MRKPKISDYPMYMGKVNSEFGNDKEMPSDNQIIAFIRKYDLKTDWNISVDNVKCDIDRLITKNKFRVSSYKDYLQKLKETFGIFCTEMPSEQAMGKFVSKYHLYTDWGITVEDVAQDLSNIMNGKWIEMLRNCEPKRKVEKPVRAMKIQKPASASQNISSSSNPKANSTSQLTRKYELELREWLHEKLKQIGYVGNSNSSAGDKKGTSVQKPISSAENKKRTNVQKTILIDGDNHINDGRRGIEQSPKDVEIIAYFRQDGAKKKFDNKYKARTNVKSILVKSVKPGDQAVDKQIKKDAGQLLKKKNQVVIIVSQDNDFKEYAKRKKEKRLGNNKLIIVKSVAEALKKDKRRNHNA